ncbi:VOC family protein [Granulicella arctica]|uniref:VOC domain-containing protein n=1 Tax=Granulicella arctica TaxID=940613 RepID=A0A7Y9PF25_9BACT|nr:VOC family protein [Granulicella arctica]NYF78742.1 hypothetical protein [Granulicella arctica]
MSETTTTAPQTPIHWFEIPCNDIDRATTFYETLLETTLTRHNLGEPMAIFAYSNGGTGGCITQHSKQKPGPQGTMVYLACNGVLDETIARVSKAGGLVLLPKTEIPGGFGSFACFRDTEGNHVGLHSV